MIGILPAAGSASRMNGLPKFLLPIPGGYLLEWHIARMAAAGCDRVNIGAAPHNHDLTNRSIRGLSKAQTWIAYAHDTMSQTVLGGYTHTTDPVLFGMPDTYFDDHQAYNKLAAALADGADVAVGLFTVRPGQYRKVGMCRTYDDQVVAVVDKPEVDYSFLEVAWGVLAWKPTFWKCIYAVDEHVGFALPRAIEAGMDVRAVRMDGLYFDCGTPDEYFECIQHLRRQEFNSDPRYKPREETR
jgi:dTDP-glucose pyrophosphorylase